jgi:hypothetical protein
VNSTVEPFVREVKDWQTEVVPIETGSRGRVFRPNLTLFVYLKIRRGSEIDLEDIRKALLVCPEKFSKDRLLSWCNPL